MPLSLSTRLPMLSGAHIPVLGLGVWQIPQGTHTESAVHWALQAGYRHIDTAKLYGNEESVGKAIRESAVPREDVFVTTKLWPTDAFAVEEAFETSLKKLGLEYIDLYLIHWPIPLFGRRIWRQLEKFQEQGLARSIGVSNFSLSQLQDVLAGASIPPSVHQMEYNPFSYEQEVVDFCHKEYIVVEAYSPLTRGLHLDNSTLEKLAQQYKKSPAQMLLRWALQKGTVVIPKSAQKEHIEENAAVFDFEITAQDMERLDWLSRR